MSAWLRLPGLDLIAELLVGLAVFPLIPILTMIDRRSPNRDDGHNFPWLINERVPGEAAVIDNLVERFEDSVR